MGDGEKNVSERKKQICHPALKYITPANFLSKLGYNLGKTIGEGSSVKVKLAQYRDDKVAVKIIDKNRSLSVGDLDSVQKFLPRELSVIKSLRHKHIIHVHDVVEYCHVVYIIMEYAQCGDLLDFININLAIEEEQAQVMFREMCEAVKYCHDMDICHRDLKCENILLDKNLHVKVSDFGFARYCVDNIKGRWRSSQTYCGTTAYAAPEVLQRTPYNPKISDVWSLGVILYTMIFASLPYDDSNVTKMYKSQMSKKVGFPTRLTGRLSSEVKQLIHHMLEINVTKRATLDQILDSDWLKINVESRMRSHTTMDYSVQEMWTNVKNNCCNAYHPLAEEKCLHILLFQVVTLVFTAWIGFIIANSS